MPCSLTQAEEDSSPIEDEQAHSPEDDEEEETVVDIETTEDGDDAALLADSPEDRPEVSSHVTSSSWSGSCVWD